MKLVSFTINSRTVHKIQHGGGRRYRKFPSKFWDLKVWHGVLFYSKLVPVHVYWYCLCYIKIWFYCTIPYWEYLEKNNVPLLKSYERFTAGSPRWRRCWWRHLPMSDNIFSSRGKNSQSQYQNSFWVPVRIPEEIRPTFVERIKSPLKFQILESLTRQIWGIW